MRLNPQETADLVTITEELLNGKLHFLCSVYPSKTDAFHRDRNYVELSNSRLRNTIFTNLKHR